MHSFLFTMCKHICHDLKHLKKLSICFNLDMFGLINSSICKYQMQRQTVIRKTKTAAILPSLIKLSDCSSVYKTFNGQHNTKKRLLFIFLAFPCFFFIFIKKNSKTMSRNIIYIIQHVLHA